MIKWIMSTLIRATMIPLLFITPLVALATFVLQSDDEDECNESYFKSLSAWSLSWWISFRDGVY